MSKIMKNKVLSGLILLVVGLVINNIFNNDESAYGKKPGLERSNPATEDGLSETEAQNAVHKNGNRTSVNMVQ